MSIQPAEANGSVIGWPDTRGLKHFDFVGAQYSGGQLRQDKVGIPMTCPLSIAALFAIWLVLLHSLHMVNNRLQITSCTKDKIDLPSAGQTAPMRILMDTSQ